MSLFAQTPLGLRVNFRTGVRRGAFVPIRRFLEGRVFDPETIESMSRALAGTCEALGLRPGDDAITRRVALRIIELARDGERDSEQLKEAALKSFQH